MRLPRTALSCLTLNRANPSSAGAMVSDSFVSRFEGLGGHGFASVMEKQSSTMILYSLAFG